MTTLLLIALLQAPDDLASFLAALEKDRAKGATSEDLLAKMYAWSADKPADVTARLAWNRELLKATIRMDGLFVEGLKRRLGKSVTLGRSTGVVKEVKPDRVVLGVSGGTIDLVFASIAFDVRLDDIKKEGLLPAKSAEEAIFRFASGRAISAMGTARGLPEGDERNRALAAIAGWVLQELDKSLAAGPTSKAAEDFSVTWAKQDDLVAAADGAIRKFVDIVLAPKLVEDADAALEKDRKEARKLLDLAAALCRSDDIRAKVAERRWSVLDKGEWMGVPLDSLMHDGGTLKGSVIAWENETAEKNRVSGVEVTSLGASWDEISGVRVKIKPVTTEYIDMRFDFGDPRQTHSVAVQIKEGYAIHVHYQKDKEPKVGAGSNRRIGKKPEYEFTATWEGKKWKFAVSGTDIDTFEIGEEPKAVSFMASKGSAELLGLQIRKR